MPKYCLRKTARTWECFLTEKTKPIYDFSSVQINLPIDIANKIIKWGETKLKDKDIYLSTEEKFGREDNIHVTILYGLHEEHPEKIKELLEKEPPIKLELGETKSFTTNLKYDVLMISVISPDLRRINKKLQSKLEFTNNYKIYHPHCTIAYMMKDAAKSFTNGKMFEGTKITVDELIFSSRNGQKTKIKLKGTPKL